MYPPVWFLFECRGSRSHPSLWAEYCYLSCFMNIVLVAKSCFPGVSGSETSHFSQCNNSTKLTSPPNRALLQDMEGNKHPRAPAVCCVFPFLLDGVPLETQLKRVPRPLHSPTDFSMPIACELQRTHEGLRPHPNHEGSVHKNLSFIGQLQKQGVVSFHLPNRPSVMRTRVTRVTHKENATRGRPLLLLQVYQFRCAAVCGNLVAAAFDCMCDSRYGNHDPSVPSDAFRWRNR